MVSHDWPHGGKHSSRNICLSLAGRCYLCSQCHILSNRVLFPDPRWGVFARSVWLLYTCCSFFVVVVCFSLYKYEWISLNDSPLSVADGQFAIKHPSCAFIMLQRAGRRTKRQWAGGASSQVTHTMKCGLFGMMARVFISFYPSSCRGIFVFSSQFPYLHFVWLYIYSVPHIPIKPSCCQFFTVLGLVGPFGVCVSCVLLGLLLGRGFFYIFDLLERGITWGILCSGNIFSFLKKNLRFSPM